MEAASAATQRTAACRAPGLSALASLVVMAASARAWLPPAVLPTGPRARATAGRLRATVTNGAEDCATATNGAEWELDCFSRPVVGEDGKKLWELLVCDRTGDYRQSVALPASKVNSRELRRVVEDLIDEAEVRPTTIRFFRKQMFNMINIALQDLSGAGTTIKVKPSRSTYALIDWIAERESDVYPTMAGYQPTLREKSASIFDVTAEPAKLPDALRGEQYAFVTLPLAEFRDQGGVTDSSVGAGRLCPVNPTFPDDATVHGVLMLSRRSGALAAWLAGIELSSMSVDLKRRQMIMEADITTRYLVARVGDTQREEAAAFERGKADLDGLHFIAVQSGQDDNDVAGFWLLREQTM